MDAGTMELTELHALLDDEVRCESSHIESPPCSVEVEYRQISCRYDRMVCGSHGRWMLWAIKHSTNHCFGCKKLVGDCWKVYPV